MITNYLYLDKKTNWVCVGYPHIIYLVDYVAYGKIYWL